jgi:hypothetical protein
MISRSRKGSLILDNQISNVINPIKEDYTTKYTRLTDDTIQEFIEARIAYIEGILNNIEKPKVTTEVKEPEETEEITLEPEPVENISDIEKDELQDIPKTEKHIITVKIEIVQ